MQSLAPQNISDGLVNRINALMGGSAYFLEENSFDIRSLLRETDKLMNASPVLGYALKGTIYQLCLNEASMRDNFRISLELASSDVSQLVNMWSIVALSNIGYSSEAQALYSELDEVDCLAFDSLERMIELGFSVLAFRKIDLFIEKAKKMNLEMPKEFDTLTADALAVLDANKISDQLLSQCADIFGEIMRENRLISKDVSPSFEVTSENEEWSPPTIFFTYKVDVDHGEAAKLYKEFTQKLIMRFDNLPDAVHFSIESSR